jgi:hypothetical protein
MALSNNDRAGLSQYLLGRSNESQREATEQRLLTDDEFFEELEIIEDELIDDYLAGELSTADRQLFEQHFLIPSERQLKLKFAHALIHPTPAPFTAPDTQIYYRDPTWMQRLLLTWNSQGWLVRASAFAAAAVIIAGAFWLALPRINHPTTYASLSLTISRSDRASGEVANKITLPLGADVLRLRLVLPETATGYRVALLKENGETQKLIPVGQDGQAVTVEIPAAHLARGRYAFNVYAIKPDGTEQRIEGSYLLTAE